MSLAEADDFSNGSFASVCGEHAIAVASLSAVSRPKSLDVPVMRIVLVMICLR
jgi:hypothetical protein